MDVGALRVPPARPVVRRVPAARAVRDARRAPRRDATPAGAVRGQLPPTARPVLAPVARRPAREPISTPTRSRPSSPTASRDVVDGYARASRDGLTVQAVLDRTAEEVAEQRVPGSVRIDSGWNCTPSTGSSRWRRPITSPSSRLGRHLEAVGHRVAVDDERVVARRGERVGQAREHAAAVVADARRLAVHHVRRAHDLAAVDLADALVPEAHAEHGIPGGAELADRVVGHAGVLGAARAGRDEHRVGLERHAARRCRRRRGGARSAPRRAHPGTARGCRRTSRSCRSRAPAAVADGTLPCERRVLRVRAADASRRVRRRC